MKTALAAALLSLCVAPAGHATGLRADMPSARQVSECIRHEFIRVSDASDDQGAPPGCARFLSTSRVVQTRRVQHA